MTKEEKSLLLQDLCGRLPYDVIVQDTFQDAQRDVPVWDCGPHYIKDNLEKVKPYLRPMSSMTEEEKEELRQEHIKDEKLFAELITKAANGDSSMRGKAVPHFAVDWCNKNHFDYRGLIPKGLALEAPEGIYNTKNE